MDLKKTLTNLHGTDLTREGAGDSAEPLTIAWAISNALVNTPQLDAMSIEESMRRYNLHTRISDANVVELSAEDIVLIKNAVAATYTPIIVGQIVSEIDPAGAGCK